MDSYINGRVKLTHQREGSIVGGWVDWLNSERAEIESETASDFRFGDVVRGEVNGAEHKAVFLGEVVSVIGSKVLLELSHHCCETLPSQDHRFLCDGLRGYIQLDRNNIPMTVENIGGHGLGVSTQHELPILEEPYLGLNTYENVLLVQAEVIHSHLRADGTYYSGLQISKALRIEPARLQRMCQLHVRRPQGPAELRMTA